MLSEIDAAGQNARMPKSKRNWLRWLIWGLLGLSALLMVTYTRLTDPARLRASVLAAFQRLPVKGVDLGEARFSLRHGLELTDLVFDPPRAADVIRGNDAGPLLRIGTVRLSCAPGSLLLGRVEPTRIELSNVAASIVCNPGGESDSREAELVEVDVRRLWDLLSQSELRLPEFEVAQGDVQLLVRERGRAQLLQRLLVRAVGRPTDDGFELRIERRPLGDTPLAEVKWDQRSGELTLTGDWVDLRTVARLMPPRAADALARLDLAGRARLARLVLRENTDGDATASTDAPMQLGPTEVRLADVRCRLPLDEEEHGASDAAGPGECYLQMAHATAALVYRPGAGAMPGVWELRAEGQLHAAPAVVEVHARADALRRLWRAPDTAETAGLCLDDIPHADVQVSGLELPTERTFPAFVHARQLPGPLAAVFRDYVPRGRVNLHVRLLPDGACGADGTVLAGAGRLEAEIEALGAACRYRHFPYDFEDARGTLRLTGGRVLFDNLTARHGAGRITATGVVNNTRSWAGFELCFRGQDVALNDDLYAALPDKYRRLWRQAAPLGLCDVAATVGRPEGSAATGALPADVAIEAHLLGGSLALAQGRRLDHVDGWLNVGGDALRVQSLHGYDGDAGVWLDGDLRLRDGDTQTDLRVAVSDLPLGQSTTLGARGGAAAPAAQFAGLADVVGRIAGTPAEGAREQHLAVRIKTGRLHGLDAARVWVVEHGLVLVRGTARRLVSFVCAQGADRLELSGALPPEGAAPGPLDLDVHAQTTGLQELYPQFIPPAWAELVDEVGLAGAADVTVRLRREDAGGSGAEQIAEVTMHAAQMRARSLPLALRDVDAEVALSPGRFRVVRAAAACGTAGKVLVTQPQDGTWGAGHLDALFDIVAEQMVLDDAARAALPEKAAELLERLEARGEFDAYLPRVHVSGAAERTWRLEGRLPLRNAALQMGLDLRLTAAQLYGTCTIGPTGAVDLEAQFDIEAGQLGGRRIARWEGLLRRAAGERWVVLENLQGQLCDGAAQGALRIDPQTSDYELSLRLYGVSAAELLPPRPDRPEQRRPGRIDGEVWLRGRGADSGSRRGGGHLRISGASFLQTPVLASIFTVRPQAGRSETVDQADLRFLWEGHEVWLEHIVIDSRDLRLVGTGTWDLRDDSVRMTLWGARPETWPRISVLTELLETAGQELIQYRVDGTLAKTRVTAEPLYRLNDALRRALGEQ